MSLAVHEFAVNLGAYIGYWYKNPHTAPALTYPVPIELTEKEAMDIVDRIALVYSGDKTLKLAAVYECSIWNLWRPVIEFTLTSTGIERPPLPTCACDFCKGRPHE